MNDNLFSKKNLITYLLLAILAVAIPLGIQMVQQQIELRTKATGEEIKFSGTGVSCDPSIPASGVQCTTTNPTITVELTSPFGGPVVQEN